MTLTMVTVGGLFRHRPFRSDDRRAGSIHRGPAIDRADDSIAGEYSPPPLIVAHRAEPPHLGRPVSPLTSASCLVTAMRRGTVSGVPGTGAGVRTAPAAVELPHGKD